jgi:tetratricopeptide (TPR) repeat protein
MNHKLLSRITWYFMFILGIVFCLKAIREPDLWWMYRTGEWMWSNGVTYTDPFSYTQEGTEWINVKWFFEIIISTFKAIGGPEMVFVLQAIFTFLILFFISKTTKVLHTKIYPQATAPPYLAMAIAGVIALISMDFRMIGRPEMSSHLLTAVYLYLFVFNHKNPDNKWIYALIPLQLLWTNLHEAFGVGMVLLIAFLGATWVEYYFRKNIWGEKNQKMPLLLTYAGLGALAVIVINPRGPEMWLHPFNIFGQLQDNKFTTELLSYKDAAYWAKEAYLNLGFFALAALAVVFLGLIRKRIEPIVPKIKSPNNKKAVVGGDIEPWSLLDRFGLGHLLLGAMLFYLSLTAYRNIPFFVIAATPLAALSIYNAFQWLYKKAEVLKIALAGMTLLLFVGLYLSVVSSNYHKWTDSRDYYGLQVLNSHNPVGAANFIKENDIKGRAFADYLSSAYLLWALQPDFKTYIDLRDLDIFPSEFFNQYNQLLQQPGLFDKEDQKYKFDYVVLLRRNIEVLPQLFVHLDDHPNYELVFVDPVAAIYLKKTEENKAVIEKFGLSKGKDVYHPLEKATSSTLPFIITKIFNPFFQNKDYAEVDQDAIIAHFYYAIGESDRALSYAQKSIDRGLSDYRGYEIKGLVNARYFLDPESSAEKKKNAAREAETAFRNALTYNEKSLESLFGLGVLLKEQKKCGEAVQYFQSAKLLAPQHPMIQQHLNTCYQEMQKMPAQERPDSTLIN